MAVTDQASNDVRFWRGSVLSALLVFSTAGLVQAQEAPNRLVSVEVKPLSGTSVQVRLNTTAAAPAPLSFTIDQPARLAIDLADVELALAERRVDVGAAGLDSVVAAQAGGRTRIVFNLDAMQPYTAVAQGNSILVTLGEEPPPAAAPQAVAQPAALEPAAPAARGVRGVDFRRSPDGSGRVIVRLSDKSQPASLRQEGNTVIVDFAGAKLPDDLLKRYDVMDFATPVSTVEVMRNAAGAQIRIAASGDFEQLAYQTDDTYVVEVKERPKQAALTEAEKVYTGERLTLNFQDIDVRAVLQLLADTSGQNIVVSDSVSGRVTLRLQNVPWDQALDIVLRTRGLGMRTKDNVILVAPQAELAARERAELEALNAIEELVPLRTEFLQVNYAKAGTLSGLLSSAGGGSLLSDRGNVSVDERTNTLIVQDTADRLEAIRSMVAALDIPVRQVLIESRIVIVSDDLSRELGVRWGFNRVSDDVGDFFAISGSANASDSIMSSALENLADSGSPSPVQIPFGNFDRYNVNLPAGNPTGRLALAILDFDDYLIDLELSAAQAEGTGKIVSSPRVITANQSEATIKQGVEIPYQESASSGATATQFKEAVLSLKVTPQITPDNRVILDLEVNKDSVGQLVPSATGGFVPSIDTREITTQVLVNDGQTVVLGGIMETEQRESSSKVPFFGDLPGLGVLFRNNNRISARDELLIFVTPKILREGASIE